MKIRALLSLFLVTAVFLSACGNSKGESSKEGNQGCLGYIYDGLPFTILH